MPWIVFALATPIFYGTTNFIDKFLVEKRIREPIVLTVLTGYLASLVGVLVILARGLEVLEASQIGLLFLAGILLNIYLLPYFDAIRLDDVSRVMPLFQFIPIFVLVMSAIFLQESFIRQQLLGFVLIVAGGFIIATERIEGGILRPRKLFWLMMLSSFLYASVGIVFRFVVRSEDFWTTLSYEYLGSGLGATLILSFYLVRQGIIQEVKAIRSALGLVGLNTSLGVAAQLTEAYAISLAPVALVITVESPQPLFVFLVGLALSIWFPKLIKEDIRATTLALKLMTIILILLGVYLIYQSW